MKPPLYIGPDKRIPQSPCPVCKHALNGITPTSLDAPESPSDWEAPKAGDFSICVFCAAMLRFTSASELKEITSEDLRELLSAEPETFAVLQKLAEYAEILKRQRQRGKFRSN